MSIVLVYDILVLLDDYSRIRISYQNKNYQSLYIGSVIDFKNALKNNDLELFKLSITSVEGISIYNNELIQIIIKEEHTDEKDQS